MINAEFCSVNDCPSFVSIAICDAVRLDHKFPYESNHDSAKEPNKVLIEHEKDDLSTKRNNDDVRKENRRTIKPHCKSKVDFLDGHDNET